MARWAGLAELLADLGVAKIGGAVAAVVASVKAVVERPTAGKSPVVAGAVKQKKGGKKVRKFNNYKCLLAFNQRKRRMLLKVVEVSD